MLQALRDSQADAAEREEAHADAEAWDGEALAQVERLAVQQGETGAAQVSAAMARAALDEAVRTAAVLHTTAQLC